MLLAGDEIGNSQGGNNNAYCQDNETGWIDWSGLGQPGADLRGLIDQLILLRRAFPQLQGQHWLHGHLPDGKRDVKWLTPAGTEMQESDWEFAEARFLAYVLAPITEHGAPLFIVLNAAADAIAVVMPEWPGCARWSLLLSTDSPKPDPVKLNVGTKSMAPARSVTVFVGLP
jgi:glycogen operon protein